MRDIRIAVVEDNATECQQILDYLDRYQNEHNEHFEISTFDDGSKIAEHYRPVYDILLLDIEMEKMDGMETARRVREVDDGVVIVFITAAPQYAINGYEVQALSYLLKPVPWFAFSQEMKRSVAQARRRENQSILIQAGSRQTRIELDDILYIESVRHTIIFHMAHGSISTSSSLKEMENRLAPHGFFRSNSCYLVNLHHVTGVDDQDSIMSNGEHLRISRPRKKAFTIALTNYINGDGR